MEKELLVAYESSLFPYVAETLVTVCYMLEETGEETITAVYISESVPEKYHASIREEASRLFYKG